MDPYGSAAQAVQAQFVGEFADPHGVGKILFVCKHQKDGVLQLVFLDLRGYKSQVDVTVDPPTPRQNP